MAEVGSRAARKPRAVSAREAVKEHLTAADVLKSVGPGVISGGADNDPAGIATYSVVGATAGFAQNWLLLLSTPMLIVVMQMSAKVAHVTKTDLATVLRTTYGARVATPAVLLMVIANVITMGADLHGMFGCSAPTLRAVSGVRTILRSTGRARSPAFCSRAAKVWLLA